MSDYFNVAPFDVSLIDAAQFTAAVLNVALC